MTRKQAAKIADRIVALASKQGIREKPLNTPALLELSDVTKDEAAFMENAALIWGCLPLDWMMSRRGHHLEIQRTR